jgi:hypothetical protein
VKVKELIEKLQTFDPEMDVVLPMYEEGSHTEVEMYTHIDTIFQAKVLYGYDCLYYDPYEPGFEHRETEVVVIDEIFRGDNL